MTLLTTQPTIDKIETRIVYTTGYNRKYQVKRQKDNPWFKMIEPLINHKSWNDDQGNRYKFVREVIADKTRTDVDRSICGKWGQIMWVDRDGEYWRIGFDNLASRDQTTVPDCISSNQHGLVLCHYDYDQRKVICK